MPRPCTSRLTKLKRGGNLVLKLFKALLLIGVVFPHIRPSERDVIIEGWCREVLEVLSIRLILRGEAPQGRVSSVLFVANHVSWMDILVINACRRVQFVAKAEVRRWPLVGWMAARTGTLFLKRTSPHDLARVTKSVATVLRRGNCIALFPEGTTTDGTAIRAFHSGLFESAITAQARVWPVAITYQRLDGSLDREISFVDNQSLVSSILNVLGRPTTQAQLSFSSPFDSSSGDRRELTAWCHQAIEQSLAGYLPCTVPLRPPLRYPADESFPPMTAA
ncbi:MAG: 1-acyl-sn-glycerol-3-phosphate acyltransferase [Nitrospirae bacterium]|nr:1-acyl-sn-glycerol-3-phosphate acyltransferase [Nitrospirota bacterium]